MELKAQGIVKDLGGDGGGETVITIYCMKKTFFTIKNKILKSELVGDTLWEPLFLWPIFSSEI